MDPRAGGPRSKQGSENNDHQGVRDEHEQPGGLDQDSEQSEHGGGHTDEENIEQRANQEGAKRN